MRGMNYYAGTVQSPYHLSVGCVLRNKDGQIAHHYFDRFEQYSDLNLLMRETMEPGETIEDTLHRGLLEEFGAKGTITHFLGGIISQYPDKDGNIIHKTTLYFACDLQEIHDDWRSHEDAEGFSAIQWHDPEFLVEKMQSQYQRYERLRNDSDETEIIRRLLLLTADGDRTEHQC